MFGGGRRPAARSGRRRRGAGRGQARRGGHRADVEVSFEAVEPCELCHGNGAEPGTPIETCERCGGAGQLRAGSRTPFGQVVRAVPATSAAATDKVASDPVQHVPGRGRVAGKADLKVDVPAGIDDGQRIRLSGRGHAGERGGPPGDLYVLVRVREDARFLRDGDDLVTVLDVPAPVAALGARSRCRRSTAPPRSSSRPGTQPGETVVVRGQGMPSLRSGRRGDLRVVVNVVIPRRLSERQQRAARGARPAR